jgi:hypothetical protein
MIWILSAGCNNKPANPPAAAAVALPAPLPAPKIYPKLYPAQPRIVSITPQLLEVRNGQATPTRYTVAYEIINPELVTESYIIIYSPGAGEVQRFNVPVQAEGNVEFLLDHTSVDFGPTVRLRVHCPAGDTSWYIFGTAYRTYPDGMPKGVITSVYPRYVSRFDPNGAEYMPGSAVELPIGAGNMITDGCTTEAQVEGRAVELKNTRVMNGQIKTLLLHSDFEQRPIASRYLEVKMIVSGPRGSLEVIKHLDFSE